MRSPVPRRARECLRTPEALAQSGLVWDSEAYSVTWTSQETAEADLCLPVWARDALASRPGTDACFAPATLEWQVCEARDDLIIDGPWSSVDTALPQMGPLWYTDDVPGGRRHMDVVQGRAYVTCTQDAALPENLWHAFREARAATPAPGQTPQSEVVRALHLLARLLGNALAGVDRPVPLDGKTFSQQLRWDPPLQALMEGLEWRVAPLDDARPALHAPLDLLTKEELRTRTARLWLELAVLCVSEGGLPPPLPDAAPAGLAWRIERAAPLVPLVPWPDARMHRACARLGLGTHQIDAERAVALYQWQVACFPAHRSSLVRALETLQARCGLGEPVSMCLAQAQSEGVCLWRDVMAAHERLGLSVPSEGATLWDEPVAPTTDEVLAAYQAAVQEVLRHGTDAEYASAQQALRTLSKAYAEPAWAERAEANPWTPVERAYELLQVSADIDDALVVVGYEVYASETTTRPLLLRLALEAVADARGSMYLHRYLRGDDPAPQDTTLPRGLENIGNTCYLNSLLQYVCWMVPVRDMVRALAEATVARTPRPRVGGREVTDAERERAVAFAAQLRALLDDMVTSDAPALKPSQELAYLALVPLAWEQATGGGIEAREALLGQVSTQQDVCECLDNMLFLLEVAWACYETTPTDLARLCTGVTTQTLVTQPEGRVQTQDETFKSVPVTLLPESHDLYEALDTFFGEEGVEMGTVHVQRTVMLKEAPPLLQIHVQRVQYDRARQCVVKNQAPLDLPDTLYLDRYMEGSSALHTATHTRRQRLMQLRERVCALDKAASVLSGLDAALPRLATAGDELATLVGEHEPGTLQNEAQRVRCEAEACRAEMAELRAANEAAWRDEQHRAYDLTSVFMHRGEATHGHYFLNQWDRERGAWLSLNDARVTPISRDEAVKDPTGATSYLVVYVQREAAALLGPPRAA